MLKAEGEKQALEKAKLSDEAFQLQRMKEELAEIVAARETAYARQDAEFNAREEEIAAFIKQREDSFLEREKNISLAEKKAKHQLKRAADELRRTTASATRSFKGEFPLPAAFPIPPSIWPIKGEGASSQTSSQSSLGKSRSSVGNPRSSQELSSDSWLEDSDRLFASLSELERGRGSMRSEEPSPPSSRNIPLPPSAPSSARESPVLLGPEEL